MIHGEGARQGPTLYSETRVNHYLQQGCFWFLAYAMDMQENDKVIVDDVPIVQEYPDVFLFLEDFPVVPLER